MSDILILCEHDRGSIEPSTLEALTFARGAFEGDDLHVLVCGEVDDLAPLGEYGATAVIVAEHDMLRDFSPETWGQVLAQQIDDMSPEVVLACGTSRGNEVLAQAAARLDMPFVANVNEVADDFADDDETEVTRVQWGGSLLERAGLEADTKIISVTHHAVEPVSAEGEEAPSSTFEPEIDELYARSIVIDREIAEAGVTLSTAPVVVGGGRAVGSADAFAPLEELAELLGGRVGCSRAVTNNGWRPHSDQVGQTGTRIAPELYIANGISGAIQHWVGAMASKKILAINTDPDANMVTKADYCVIGDLHDIIPAVIEEVKKRS